MKWATHERAREIMGTNFFGIEEAKQYFGISPSQRELRFLSEIPFTEATLIECKDTHVLEAVLPLSILDMRRKNPELFYHLEDYHYEAAFIQDRGAASWQLVGREYLGGTHFMSWDEQQLRLASNERTPSARTLVYMMVGHFLATGERLFQFACVRTCDRRPHYNRVDIGGFEDSGMMLDGWHRGRDNVGLAYSRKYD